MAKILIIDDESDQEEIIVQRFGHKEFLQGFEFLYASNGLEALEKMNQYHDIELLLVDLNMPKLDGLSFLEKISSTDTDYVVIMISAYGDMANIRSAMNQGAYDFINKPIQIGDLERTLRKAIAQLNKLKNFRKESLENMRLRQRAVELELQALRAQMNPHFVFNSLSSINNFILKNESELASGYLLKFAQLIRAILEFSNKSLISLETELGSLKWYIDLMALRLPFPIRYDLNLSPDIDTGSVKVPPLILQPYVENALQHGLMPKNEPGHLQIRIQENEAMLEIVILDDGVGRASAQQVSNRNPLKKKSMGMQISQQRIDLLSSHRPGKVIINDLVDPSGQACGTEVHLSLPFIL
jgi:sensor histidine kinase YesM